MDFLADLYRDAGYNAGHWRADVIAIASFGLGAALGGGLDQTVGHPDDAGLTIEFKKDFDLAFFIGFAKGLKTDLQGLPGSISAVISSPGSMP